MKDKRFKLQTLLSSLWIFILFNMLLRDMHQFLNPQFMDELVTQNISEELVLMFGIILEIPILMVPLSLTLKDTLNKWTNILASCIALLGISYSLLSADLDDLFFAIVQIGALLIIVRTAFKLSSSRVKEIV